MRMKNPPTPEQLAKLPKWAQQAFHDLSRERDVAVRELNQWIDHQTPSEISIDEHPCLGEGNSNGPSFKTRFVQGESLTFKHAGIELSVNIYRPGKIILQWNGFPSMDEAAFIPTGFQSAELIAWKNMRVHEKELCLSKQTDKV